MKVSRPFIFLFVLLLTLAGCDSNSRSAGAGDKDIFQYKNSYVGDNSAIGSILGMLPQSDRLKQFSLNTAEKPYRITVQYNEAASPMSESEIRETVIFNATFLFALVQNVDQVHLELEGQSYLITREQLQSWYGKELDQFENEQDLRKLTQEFVPDKDKVDQLFAKLQQQ
ncbi:DUF4825 domain-containing protein [Paenibacillus thiaminolyticus]|uniref:DUF4825 domain-containing protein n=1 Tax=Paenibacillus thiaminolyticus TaxID=49283 RepID=A0AAP9DW26_PANTH|nr:DUF4825 domain-containing protein [Paenibacillus thiaminolyticus]MCY9539011.1 DUF4825 domain-containing protein [Paenibacillus thiaminolyticus]MCY9604203.1 DUF4825 domain-containing protein [Paenibacillus thiaminolyticus]MCY9608123.1 DUF4825 domain-containing protein [Paenibacillus thiaminolyticus]MCY9612961.1 DUF4825 domain-containing protein [Paenibacillus thiaminolyticus]MCY9621984.1 DUF4825 domain-containing protein [Paenibacillus thiaminolyticus]